MRRLNQKIVAALLIVTILIGFVPITSTAHSVPSQVQISLSLDGSSSNTIEAKKGDKVKVLVDMKNGMDKISVLAVAVKYDKTVLKPIVSEYSDSDILFDYSMTENFNNKQSIAIGSNTMSFIENVKDESGNATNNDEIYFAFAYTSTGKYIGTSGELAAIEFEVIDDITSNKVIEISRIKAERNDDPENGIVGDSYTINPTGSKVTLKANVPMTGLTVSPETITMAKTDSAKTITVSKVPITTTDTTNVTFTSSNTGVAKVTKVDNTKATIVPVAKGTANITVKCGSYSKTVAVTVTSPLTGVTISSSNTEVAVGKTVTVTGAKVPADADGSDVISYESLTPAIATVSSTGVVTGVSNGTAKIVAKCGAFTSTPVEIEVYTPIDGLTLNKTNGTVSKGDTVELTASKLPSTTTNTTPINWSVENSSVAQISATTGDSITVTAVGRGTTTVTASCSGKTATYTIKVLTPLTSISIDGENSFNLNRKQSKDLTVIFNPVDTTDSKAVTWSSSDSTVVKVENGKITALKVGTATITATSTVNPSISASVEVNVPRVQATGLDLDVVETTIDKGLTKVITATVLPNNNTDDLVVTWESSNPEIAIVTATSDNKATIKAIGGGTTTITAKAEGLAPVTATVNVYVPVESIEFGVKNYTLEVGDTDVLSGVTINPADATLEPTDRITFKSLNENIVTVDENGTIKAIAPGLATIEANLKGRKTYARVESIISLVSVSINNGDQELSLFKGAKANLSTILNPTNATVVPTPVWSSSNENVAKVNGNGVVTAVSEGTATITVTYGSLSATRNVVVEAVPDNCIAFFNNPENIIAGLNNSINLDAVLYLNGEESSEKIVWTSSDETIAVVSNGVVRGLKTGVATITATYGDLSKSITLSVTATPLVSISPKKPSMTLTESEKGKIELIFNPVDTTDDTTVTFTSSNESVATVDENGNVTALKNGTTTITITSTVNPEISTSVLVTVKEKVVDPVITGNPANGVKPNKPLTTTNSGENPKEVDEKVPEVVGNIVNGIASTVKSPHTGDMNVELLAIMFIISLAGIVVIIKKNK